MLAVVAVAAVAAAVVAEAAVAAEVAGAIDTGAMIEACFDSIVAVMLAEMEQPAVSR